MLRPELPAAPVRDMALDYAHRLDAITDLCATYEAKDGRIPCRLIRKALDGAA